MLDINVNDMLKNKINTNLFKEFYIIELPYKDGHDSGLISINLGKIDIFNNDKKYNFIMFKVKKALYQLCWYLKKNNPRYQLLGTPFNVIVDDDLNDYTCDYFHFDGGVYHPIDNSFYELKLFSYSIAKKDYLTKKTYKILIDSFYNSDFKEMYKTRLYLRHGGIYCELLEILADKNIINNYA